MSIFSKSEQESPDPVENNQPANQKHGKKGRPTPKRKEAEAARRNPIVPADRKAAKARSKELKAQERARRDAEFMRQQQAMRDGDERYMPAREKGPARRYIRDYTDSRWTLSEFVMPVALIGMIASFALVYYPYWRNMLTIFIYVYLLVCILEGFFANRAVRKNIATKHPKWDLPPRTGWYLWSRMIMPRPLRNPRPQVKRGEDLDR
ncbi:hypothetical protein BK816_04825 [Boudabousia tangfeifanii]|uniref:DUF3043 domain-containing protein n=1 Tax=Boudabousia tangfeifanii TaxID=1912795 RepID=A0A1D9MK66_9ACTO|nr:DUF3043 domain-containing protein [Boudabousia tangfeifanii]AOZ72697.1 hypothetical protein BK816_04825 [Boudabousia tangfeifanii]